MDYAASRNRPRQIVANSPSCREFLGHDAVVAMKGGYPMVNDAYNTSHGFRFFVNWADDLGMEVSSRADNGVPFVGDRGRLFVNRERISRKPIEEGWDAGHIGDEELHCLYKGKPYGSHKESFYRCLHEGGETVSDGRSHAAAMDLCHPIAITARLGRESTQDHATWSFTGDDQATAMLAAVVRKGYELGAIL